MAAGSILAIVLGSLLALSLIATGYLFFDRRRGKQVQVSETAVPFAEVEYHSLRPPPPGLLQRSSHISMQSADTNPEVSVSHLLVHAEIANRFNSFVLLDNICSPFPRFQIENTAQTYRLKLKRSQALGKRQIMVLCHILPHPRM